jgi:hypothetical protein
MLSPKLREARAYRHMQSSLKIQKTGESILTLYKFYFSAVLEPTLTMPLDYDIVFSRNK